MNTTGNYNLNQWDGSDRILRTDFNADNAKVDTALKTNADGIAALAEQLAGKGNCQIYFTTYTGNGTHDEAGASTLTFPHRPLLVFITETFDSGSMVAQYGAPTVYFRVTGAAWNNATWGDRSFTWYASSATSQMNENGKVYNVVALMDVED